MEKWKITRRVAACTQVCSQVYIILSEKKRKFIDVACLPYSSFRPEYESIGGKQGPPLEPNVHLVVCGMPVSIASSEPSFGIMPRVKNYLRLTI